MHNVALKSPKMSNPLVNIISMQIIAERTREFALPASGNMVLNAPDGLLDRAAHEMNLGRHLTEYAMSHPPTTEIIPEFFNDSERRRFFESKCSVATWYCYYEHGGLGFRYNVIVELDQKTYRAAEATKQQDMPIEMALIDLDELRKAFKK